MSESCEWPGCTRDALCQSGNFGNRSVCAHHFSVTNGHQPIGAHDATEIAHELVTKTAECERLKDELDHFREMHSAGRYAIPNPMEEKR